MNSEMSAHGSFGVSFHGDYTLITATGCWNLECAKIYAKVLSQQGPPQPGKDRCVILNGLEWELETHEAEGFFKRFNQRISEYYNQLYLAYLIRPAMTSISEFIFSNQYRGLEGKVHWTVVESLDLALKWFRQKGKILPALSMEDFPAARDANDYL